MHQLTDTNPVLQMMSSVTTLSVAVLAFGSPSQRIVIWSNIEILWEAEQTVGIYAIPAMLVQASSPQILLYVGVQANLNVQWQQNQHRGWTVDAEHCFAGAFLRDQVREKCQLLCTWRDISFLSRHLGDSWVSGNRPKERSSNC